MKPVQAGRKEAVNYPDQQTVGSPIRCFPTMTGSTGDLHEGIQRLLRLARENPNNQRPVNTIAAFKANDYLNWEEFEKNPEKPQFHCTPATLLKEAEQLFDEFLLSDEIKKREDRALFAQALLLKMTEEWLSKQDPVESKPAD